MFLNFVLVLVRNKMIYDKTTNKAWQKDTDVFPYYTSCHLIQDTNDLEMSLHWKIVARTRTTVTDSLPTKILTGQVEQKHIC